MLFGATTIITLSLTGCFGNSDKNVIESNIQTKPTKISQLNTNTINSLKQFTNLIKFKDGSKLKTTEIEEVFFTKANGHHDNVSSMQVKNFYNANVGEEKILRKVIKMFAEMQRIPNIKPIAFKDMPKYLQLHTNVIRPTTPNGENIFAKTKDNLVDKFRAGETTAEENKELSYLYNLQGLYEISDKIDWENNWILGYQSNDVAEDTMSNSFSTGFIYYLANRLNFTTTLSISKRDGGVDEDDAWNKKLVAGIQYRLK